MTEKIAGSTAGFKAVARLYNALMTGLVLTLVTRRDPESARGSASPIFAASISKNSCRACRSSASIGFRTRWPAPSITIFQTRSAA